MSASADQEEDKNPVDLSGNSSLNVLNQIEMAYDLGAFLDKLVKNDRDDGIFDLGDTPSTVASTVEQTLTELQTAMVKRFFVLCVKAAVGGPTVSIDYLNNIERAPLVPYIKRNFLIKENLNFYALCLAGHCIIAIARGINVKPFVDFRQSINGNSIWEANLRTAQISENQRYFYAEFTRKFCLEEARKAGKRIVTAVDRRIGVQGAPTTSTGGIHINEQLAKQRADEEAAREAAGREQAIKRAEDEAARKASVAKERARKLAARKAIRKAAEDAEAQERTRKLAEEEAARKAAKDAEAQERARKLAEEVAARKAAERARLHGPLWRIACFEAEQRARKLAEEEAELRAATEVLLGQRNIRKAGEDPADVEAERSAEVPIEERVPRILPSASRVTQSISTTSMIPPTQSGSSRGRSAAKRQEADSDTDTDFEKGTATRS